MIHFIGGEKGGVGKSVISRLLAQYFIDNQVPFTGYDTDRSHNTFLRFYKDYASSTTVDSYEQLDALIENFDSQVVSRIIVDLAAQTNLPLLQWIEDSNVIELSNDLNLKLKFWHVNGWWASYGRFSTIRTYRISSRIVRFLVWKK